MMFGLGLSCLSLDAAGSGILQTATAVVSALNPFAETVTALPGYVIIAGSASITVQAKPGSYGTAQTVAGSVTSGGAVSETTAGSVLAAAPLAGWLDGETPIITVTLEVAAVPTTGLVYRPDFTNFAYLWQDSSGTAPVTAAGQNIGRAADTSGASIVAAALQAVSANRPILGRVPASGRRNMLTYTEQFDSSSWVKANVAIGQNAIAAPDGTITADKIIPASGAVATVTANVTVAQSAYTCSLYAKASEKSVISIVSNITGTYRSNIFDLTAVTATPGTGWTASITPVGGGWYRCTCSAVADVASSKAMQITNNSAGWTGDGSSGVYVWGAQIDLGATATAYQRVVSQYDVTEAGQADKWYLYDNDVNYALTVALTGTYSVYWDVAGALQYAEAVSMAGAYDILRNGMRRCAIYNRALDAGERAALAAYWGATA